MGLDMYVYALDRSALINPDAAVDLASRPDAPTAQEFAYWRKFNALHNWMHQLYKRKGGTSGEFNLNTVRLEPADLDQLEADLKNSELKPVQGPFFGPQEIHPEDVESTREFIARARAELDAGKVVVYDSWW